MRPRSCLSATLILCSALAWGADATGFTVTMPCGAPPFGAGKTDMHLHLVHFPKQGPGQEIVLMMPSMLGETGVRDWVDAVGKLCNTYNSDACSNAETARVRVLDYSARYFLGTYSAHVSPAGLKCDSATARALKEALLRKNADLNNHRASYVNEEEA